jgi:Arm DNA-binding domain
MDYRFAGKRRTLAIGVYPSVTLAAARERREEARALGKRHGPGRGKKGLQTRRHAYPSKLTAVRTGLYRGTKIPSRSPINATNQGRFIPRWIWAQHDPVTHPVAVNRQRENGSQYNNDRPHHHHRQPSHAAIFFPQGMFIHTANAAIGSNSLSMKSINSHRGNKALLSSN